MLGYKTQPVGSPLKEFEVGDKVIVLTHKGEPVMSGEIVDTRQDETTSSAMVGDRWWDEASYTFRRM
jgi:hypothetical protein